MAGCLGRNGSCRNLVYIRGTGTIGRVRGRHPGGPGCLRSLGRLHGEKCFGRDSGFAVRCNGRAWSTGRGLPVAVRTALT